MNSSGGFNYGMGGDQVGNQDTYNYRPQQNDGQTKDNDIESSTQQQEHSI